MTRTTFQGSAPVGRGSRGSGGGGGSLPEHAARAAPPIRTSRRVVPTVVSARTDQLSLAEGYIRRRGRTMLLLPSVAFALPGADVQWTVLQKDDPFIECAVDAAGEPWCRSTGLVKLPLEKVAATLEDMPRYQHLFE